MAERSSERGHPTSKEAEENMTRLVEGKVDEVKKAFTRVIGLHRCENEFPPPYEEEEKNENPSTKVKRINVRSNKKDKFFEKTTHCGCLPFFFLSDDVPPQWRLAVFSIFLKNNAAP